MKNFWRHLVKYKTYAAINLIGLSIGLAVTTLIVLHVFQEFDYDNFLPGYSQVIRIQPTASTGELTQQWATTEGFLVPALAGTYPEIEAGTRILPVGNALVFRVDSTSFSQKGVILADEGFFDVFPYPFVHGDRATALKQPNGIVISEATAVKFFGDDNPMGRMLTTSFMTFQVTGVFRDIPVNSHLHFTTVFSLRVWMPDADQGRQAYSFYSYLRLRPTTEVRPFIDEKLRTWYGEHGYADEGQPSTPRETEIVLQALPIRDIHLQSHAEKEFEPNSQLQIVYLFVAVAVLVLVIATINYVNLSNSLAIRRAREVAVRKTVGASRRRLFLGFMGESAIFTAAAFALSIGLCLALISPIARIGGPDLSLSTFDLTTAVAIGIVAWITLALLAGCYPAAVLSSFDPIQALRSGQTSGKSNPLALGLRRGLTVFQFAISSFMTVCAFTIHQQMQFIKQRDIGFEKDRVITLPLTDEAGQRRETLKSEMLRLPEVQHASISSVVPGLRVVYLTVRVPDLAGKKNNAETEPDGTTNMRVMSVDRDFVKTMGLQIVEGRDFSPDNAADLTSGFLLNEAAVKEFGMTDPIGRPFEFTFRRTPKVGTVIGVVKDFHFASMHAKVEPLMMHYDSLFMTTLSIRLKPGNIPDAVARVEQTWRGTVDVPFSFQFLDAQYDALYRSEQNTSTLITVLTLLALLLACLGLFGMVSFFVVQRTREVGIRKVFGASQASLFRVLSNEYLILVIVGNLAAVYPAFLVSNKWLEQFSYRTDLTWPVYVAALGVSCTLAALSIFHVILKTSRINPAITLASRN